MKVSQIRWSEEELNCLLLLLEKKQNINLEFIQTKLYNKTNILRSFNGIYKKIYENGFKIRNRHNQSLQTEYYHITEFIKYGYGTKRIKEILEKNNIKVYNRCSSKMIHVDDIERAEEVIKKNEKTNTQNLVKKYKSSKTLVKENNITYDNLNSFIENKIITPTLKVSRYMFFDKAEEKKLKNHIKELYNEYYSTLEIENIFNLGKGCAVRFLKRLQIPFIKFGHSHIYKKTDIQALQKKDKEIRTNYVHINEVKKVLKLSKSSVYQIFQKHNIKKEYWLRHAYISKKDFELLVNVITNKDQKQ